MENWFSSQKLTRVKETSEDTTVFPRTSEQMLEQVSTLAKKVRYVSGNKLETFHH